MLALGWDDERVHSAPEYYAREVCAQLDFVVVAGSVARMNGQEQEHCQCRIHEESAVVAVIEHVSGFWKIE